MEKRIDGFIELIVVLYPADRAYMRVKLNQLRSIFMKHFSVIYIYLMFFIWLWVSQLSFVFKILKK